MCKKQRKHGKKKRLFYLLGSLVLFWSLPRAIKTCCHYWKYWPKGSRHTKVFISPLRFRCSCLFRCFHFYSATIFFVSLLLSFFERVAPKAHRRDRKLRHVVVLRWGGCSSFQFSTLKTFQAVYFVWHGCLNSPVSWTVSDTALFFQVFQRSVHVKGAWTFPSPKKVPEVFVKGKNAKRVGELRV